MSRATNEKPLHFVRDKAYLPLKCSGNGNRNRQSHAPACEIAIRADDPIWIGHWKSSPHHTIHCKACREHFFSPQRPMPFGKE